MKSKVFILLVIVTGLIIFYIGLITGSADIEWKTVASAVFDYNPNNSDHYIVLNLRMPRLLLALLAGAGLSLSGYLMQAMVNNPLADPYILGTASGASLGASLIYVIMPVSMVNILIPSVAAFTSAMIVTILAVFISYNKGHIQPSKLLLSGVALSSLTVAMMSFLIFLSNDESKLKSIIFWSMGSFEGARWSYLPLLSFTLIVGVILFTFLNKNINLLLLGESRGANLGLNVKRLRWGIIIASSIITGFAVATSGPIGFVGLMVPHIIRGLFGVTGKFNILYTAIFGGVFLLACDILSRKLYPPTGVPIGIITAFLGIPFFVYLLSKNNYRFN